jgi:hypothetical protein
MALRPKPGGLPAPARSIKFSELVVGNSPSGQAEVRKAHPCGERYETSGGQPEKKNCHDGFDGPSGMAAWGPPSRFAPRVVFYIFLIKYSHSFTI